VIRIGPVVSIDVVAGSGEVKAGSGSSVRVGAAVPPIRGACRPERYWGFAIRAMIMTMKRPPATVRISPVSTISTGSYRIKILTFP
jgi:hypothetical protein